MEFLNAQYKYISAQLRSMSASQRAAMALLLVVMLGGLYGIIQWGRQAEWTDLLNQSLTAEEMQRVEAQLRLLGVDTRVEGDRLLLRGDDNERRRVMAVLAQSNTLPKDLSLGFAALVKSENVWESDQTKVWKHHRALEAELSAVLSRFRGVKDARVFIVVPERRGLARTASTSSASVNLVLQPGESLDKQRILAVANYVAGAVPGLDAQNVKITDGSRSYAVPAGEDVAGNLLELQQQLEEYYTRKIYDQLRHIKGVVVNVQAELRQDEAQMVEKKLGPAVASSVKERTEETVSGSTAAGPGVRPNQGRALTDGGVGSSSNKTETEEALQGERDRTDTQVVRRPGAVERLKASINVPASYLQRILAVQQPEASDVSPAALQKAADAELPKIQAQVKPLIERSVGEAAAPESVVAVNWFYDEPADEASAAAEMASLDFLGLAKHYGPQAGLGLLALFSLFMMVRIARQAQVTLSGGGAAAGGSGGMGGSYFGGGAGAPYLSPLSSGVEPVGEAQEMEGVLVGHEVDEETVRTHQLVRQIGQMVKDDPATVATVVDHWLKEES